MKIRSFHRYVACLRWPRLRPLFDLATHLTDREKIELFRITRTESRRTDREFNAVEIGSYLGASASFIAAGLAGSGRVFCIDTWANDSMSEGKRDTFSEFMANTARYRQSISPIRGWSHDK